MKKITIVTVVAVALVATVFVGCKHIRGQILDGPGMERDSIEIRDSIMERDSADYTEQDKEAARAFVEQFYDEWGIEDLLEYDDLKKYITPNLLKYLADAYDYDCEGECLATWKFFYEGGGDVGEMESRQITARDENHVLVEFKYENYEYGVLLTVVKDGDTFKIDSLKQER